MDQTLIYIVTALGILALLGVLITKKPGWGPQSLAALGLVLVLVISILVGLVHKEYLGAAMGFAGAIVGNLFGKKVEHRS